MAYGTRSYASGYSASGFFPPAVKWLLIVNIGIFIVNFLAVQTGYGAFFNHFGLIPAAVVQFFAIWQLVTYMFLHDPYGFSHILFNMLMLYMFGADLERDWGSKRFLQYYFICGIGAGICVVIANALFGNMNSRTIGASGAIYGLLLAFGLLYPDRTVFFSFLFPIKAKYFVMIMGAIAFLSSFSPNNGVSHFAHLGGMIFGYFYLRSKRMKGVDLWGSAQSLYKSWKLQRAKRKFQVYMKKKNDPSDRDRWVN
jgi:membrane associated rhomboid family serine protease